MKKLYSHPEFHVDLLSDQDVISTSYVELLDQPYEEDLKNWGMIGD